jgi:isoquinoline 1-oxidoreductase beta subunit
MEVQNATALVTATSCEIWAPTQTPTSAVNEAVSVTGLTASQITLHTTFLGGGFGRRLSNDYVRQAVQVAKAMPGTPVKLVWSREEDFTHDIHRPASLAIMDAAVDGSGALTALKVRVVCGHSRNFSLEGFVGTVTNPTRDILYTYPSNYRVEFFQDTIEVPLGFWRSVGHSQNCFFFESFLDEIAVGTNQDPIAFRRRLLATGSTLHNRANAVLDKLVAESGWNTPAPTGRARGVALTMGFGDTIVGQVAEVSGTSVSNLKVEKVTVVVDAGSVINPDTVAAQMEGSIVEGLGAALFNSMTFRQGVPDHRNFNSYRMIKMSESPLVQTFIIESGAAMGGIGEPGLPPIAPAVANALARNGGSRIRSLPFISGTTTTGPITSSPTITSFTPASGPVGTVVTITGTLFTGATRVTFGGTSATTFSVVSATQIRATVPRRARTGRISITAPAGTASSATNFTVT